MVATTTPDVVLNAQQQEVAAAHLLSAVLLHAQIISQVLAEQVEH